MPFIEFHEVPVSSFLQLAEAPPQAVQSSGISMTPPSFVSSVKLLKAHFVPDVHLPNLYFLSLSVRDSLESLTKFEINNVYCSPLPTKTL